MGLPLAAQGRSCLWGAPAPHSHWGEPRTFHHLLQLVHVAELLAVVHDRLHGEDELGMDLREAVQNTLRGGGEVAISHAFKSQGAASRERGSVLSERQAPAWVPPPVADAEAEPTTTRT